MNRHYGSASCNRYGSSYDHSPARRPMPQGGSPGSMVRSARNGGCGCGCGGHNGTSCAKLMEQIRAVDFALWETVLYLDVYPHSCDALETYHKLKAQSEALHREYESQCGPLTANGNQSTSSWDWMNKPFPWEYDAN